MMSLKGPDDFQGFFCSDTNCAVILIISFCKAFSYCSEIHDRLHLIHREAEHLKSSLDNHFFHVVHHLQMPPEAHFFSCWLSDGSQGFVPKSPSCTQADQGLGDL